MSLRDSNKTIIVSTGLGYKMLELDVIGGYGPRLGELGNLVLCVSFFVLIAIELA